MCYLAYLTICITVFPIYRTAGSTINIVNPRVHLLGEGAAAIAYVKMTQFFDKEGNPKTQQVEETR